MANSASARKRARQADVQRVHNMSLRTTARTAIKNVEKAILAGDKAAAEAMLSRSASTIDRVAAKGILHRNTANRHKSRLALAVKAMQ
jgi:small subunit ribosomal protein S20